VYRGKATLTVGDSEVSGWIGCVASTDSSRPAPATSLQCWFITDSGQFDLEFRGVSTDDAGGIGNTTTSYGGSWTTDSGDASPMPTDGTGTVAFSPYGAQFAIDAWLDPAPS
jgi:hypothetical protein